MSKTTDTVEIHGAQWERTDIEENVAFCKDLSWQKQKWLPQDALVHCNGGRVSLYIGQRYDPEKIDLVKCGWSHDHCEICWWELYATDEPEHAEGYVSGNRWLCLECYTKFIEPAQAKNNSNG